MKKLFFLAFWACACICCAKNVSDDNMVSGSNIINSSDTMYVAYSVGAYQKDRLEILYPRNAYVKFDKTESGDVSISVFYSWRESGSKGFMTKIPSIGKIDISNDFNFSGTGIAIECKTWSGLWEEKPQDITVDIKCSFKKDSGEDALSLVITPSDNKYFPILKISKVSNHKIDYERGGSIVEFADEYFVFHNELDVPVSINLVSYPFHIKLDAHKSETVEADSFPGYFVEEESDAILIINESEYNVHLCSTGLYSSEDVTECSVCGGELYVHTVQYRHFNITSDLLQTLL
ncbi:MAG: hypothetical protein IJR12_04520 [Bacteroidales bacterium]|nr:hypothetical protein [Bacteroidales bacterium]